MGGLSGIMRRLPGGLSGAGLLLRRRPLPLRAVRGHGVRHLRRDVLVPKITGRMYDERLARLHFWLMFIGFNAAFPAQHMLGLMGMPRRVYVRTRGALRVVQPDLDAGCVPHGHLAPHLHLERDQELAERRRRVGNDPWTGDTLEWYATSPPPVYNFEKVPYVSSPPPPRPAAEAGELRT